MTQHFDLVLLDYHMRDGTGPELSKQIREFNSTIPILFVTGTYTMSRTEVLEAGAQGVVRKGDVADVLPAIVHNIFNGKKKEFPLCQVAISTVPRF